MNNKSFSGLPEQTLVLLHAKFTEDLNTCINDLLNVEFSNEVIKLQGQAIYLRSVVKELDKTIRSKK